jgi:hypothetical protein
MIIVIAIAACCCCLLVVIVIVVVVRRRRKHKEEKATELGEKSDGVGVTPYNIIPGDVGAKKSRMSGSSWTIPYKELKMEKELGKNKRLTKNYFLLTHTLSLKGRGAFGVVFLAKWRLQKVAVKKMKETDLSKKEVEEFEREVELLSTLRPHRSVVSFFGMCQEPLCIVLEFMAQGSIQTYLKQDVKLDLTQLYQWLIDIAAGMAHLHSGKYGDEDGDADRDADGDEKEKFSICVFFPLFCPNP